MDFFILVDILVGPELIGAETGTMASKTKIVSEVETGIEPESTEIVFERIGTKSGVEDSKGIG